MLPPVPPVKTPGAKQSRRSVSTSRPAFEEPKPGDVAHTSGDAPVHAPTSGKRPDPVPQEVAASHPGLPIKEKTESAPINIKIPKHQDPKEDPQVIVSTSLLAFARVRATPRASAMHTAIAPFVGEERHHRVPSAAPRQSCLQGGPCMRFSLGERRALYLYCSTHLAGSLGTVVIIRCAGSLGHDVTAMSDGTSFACHGANVEATRSRFGRGWCLFVATVAAHRNRSEET